MSFQVSSPTAYGYCSRVTNSTSARPQVAKSDVAFAGNPNTQGAAKSNFHLMEMITAPFTWAWNLIHPVLGAALGWIPGLGFLR